MAQQVRRIRGIEDAVGIKPKSNETPPGVRGNVSDVQDVPTINNVNDGARSFYETMKNRTVNGVSGTKRAISGNGANVGSATPCVASKDGGALATDWGSGTARDIVVGAGATNSKGDMIVYR